MRDYWLFIVATIDTLNWYLIHYFLSFTFLKSFLTNDCYLMTLSILEPGPAFGCERPPVITRYFLRRFQRRRRRRRFRLFWFDYVARQQIGVKMAVSTPGDGVAAVEAAAKHIFCRCCSAKLSVGDLFSMKLLWNKHYHHHYMVSMIRIWSTLNKIRSIVSSLLT